MSGDPRVAWFNPYNIEHLQAFRCLQETGSWPEGFIQPGWELSTLWQMAITAKIADAYLYWALGPSGKQYTPPCVLFTLERLSKEQA